MQGSLGTSFVSLCGINGKLFAGSRRGKASVLQRGHSYAADGAALIIQESLCEMAVRYTLLARVLHWVMALIIITAWGIGFYADRILPTGPSHTRLSLLTFHKEIATFVIVLFVVRVAWRATHRPPEVQGALTEDQRFVVHVAHWILYGLMLLTPMTGWLMTSAHGYPVPMLWVLHLPPLVAKNAVLAPLFTAIHQLASWVLGVFIAGHVAAALLHRFSRRDGIMETML